MGKVINVDWQRIKSVGDNFLEDSNQMSELKNDINAALDVINGSWQGVDSVNFATNCKSMIDSFEDEALYLKNWREYVTKTSNIYNNQIEDALIELRDIDAFCEDVK